MATTIDQNQPVAPVTPVATAPTAPIAQTPTTVAPVAPTPEQISQNLGAIKAPILSPVNPKAVYAKTNISQIDVPSNKRAMDMKLEKLENKLAKANSLAELNQLSIINQPKAMGVLTGEAAYRSKLDSARLNAFNSLYQNRLAEEQRKEAERQQFIERYGADPKQRPKGMSKKEFAKSLMSGGFTNLLTPEFKAAREATQLDLALKRKQLAGGTDQKTTVSNLNSLLERAAQMPSGGREWAASVAKTFGVDPADVANATAQNGWESAYRTPMTPAQQQAQAESQQKEIEGAKSAIPALESKLSLLGKVDTSGRGVGSGWTGAIERNWFDPFGSKSTNINTIKSIIGQETLSTLLALKAQGGTLGAISEKELGILQSSASTIGAAAVTDDKGNVIGYNMSEKDMEDEIKRMKESTQRVLDEARKKIGQSNNNDPLGLGL